MARDGDEADGRGHCRQGQEQRDPRGNERAEDEQQHGDRDRDRALAGLLQLVVERLVEGLARARGAGLADEEARMPLRDRGGASGQGVDALLRDLLVALHLPADLHGVPVFGDLVGAAGVVGRLELLDRRVRAHGPDDVVDDGAEGGGVGRQSLALDEHELRLDVLVGEAGALEDLVGLLGLADVRVGVVDLLGADDVADEQRGNDERKPAEDRGLPVVRAPATHPGRDVVRLLQR